MSEAIETRELVHTYPGGTTALDRVDMTIGSGSRTAIIGPNGSGKSTLLMHFNGLYHPTSGEVRVQGLTIGPSNLALIRRQVGLVFQDPDDQLFAPTVRDDIAFGPRNMGLEGEMLEERVDHILDLLHLNDLSGRPCQHLSGGQKKKVAIAGVLAMEPDIFVLDEPTTGLDHGSAGEIMDVLDELNSEGKTIVMSTHDVDLASTWADDIVVLHNGRIVTSGPPRHVFSEDLTASTTMPLPTMVRTYREFQARGIAEGRVPMTLLDLVDSMESPLIDARCAVAGCTIARGQAVGLTWQGGTILAAPDTQEQVTGRALFDAAMGDEVLVAGITHELVSGTGSISVIQIPRVIEGGSRNVDIEGIIDLVHRSDIDRVGAMGTSAKVTAKKADIHLHFEVDVIQSAMLSALRGLNCLILASGGMAGLVMERVAQRNKHSIRQISCSMITV